MEAVLESIRAQGRWVEGIVAPTSWDQLGRVTAVHLALPGEIDMVINPGPVSEELLAFGGCVIRVFGSGSPEGFDVERYKVIKLFKGEIK